MPVSLRMATVDEADLVASLRIEFIEENAGGPLPAEFTQATRAWVRALTARGAMQSWIAHDGDAAIGVVTVRIRDASPRRDDLAGKEAYVHNLYVRAAYRNAGIGRKLMQALLDWCAENDHLRVALRATEMGRPLYEKLGFVPDAAMVLPLKPNVIARRS
ncbi:MAG: GNAT family N-acetyltransferase [Vulcanimicrobiaceae bacterium]